MISNRLLAALGLALLLLGLGLAAWARTTPATPLASARVDPRRAQWVRPSPPADDSPAEPSPFGDDTPDDWAE